MGCSGMSNAIFRVVGIKTTSDLRGIGKHNADRISLTNDDIDSSRSSENIQLIEPPNSKSYLKKFFQIVEPMKLEHDEKMSTERKDRVKSFENKINSAKSDVACEFLFTSDEDFFKGKSKEEIKTWANESLDFVKKEIGIEEDNILHAVVHMDEKTPHLHVVAVPLVKKYDGRAKRELWQLNRKHFIETKFDLSKLQDKYHERMQNKGYDLERGQVGSKAKHLSTEDYKAKKLKENVKELEEKYEKLENELEGLEKTVEVVKEVDSVKIEKGLFGSKTVKIALEDFEVIKALAKTSEALKTQNKQFERDNKILKRDNVALNFGNTKLNEENKELKKENSMLLKEKNTWVIASEDIENMDVLTKVSEVLKTQNNDLKLDSNLLRMENTILNDKNIALENQNQKLMEEKQELVVAAENLKRENKQLESDLQVQKGFNLYYQRVIEEMKRLAEQYLSVEMNKMIRFVGQIRMLTVGKIYGADMVDEKVMKVFVEEDEREGAKEYIEFYKKNALRKEVAEKNGEYQPERTKDDFEMER